jgi:catechol 2,3-dioxygenase-like lactoylglutathione lyase family enzyme
MGACVRPEYAPPRAPKEETLVLAYTTIGTSDMDRAVAFYDALLAEIGAKRLFGMDRIQFYGTSARGAMLAVCIPYDGNPHERGNGWMVAIPGGSREGVDRLHARALELGASDEGAPGERIPNFFYGAYVRDLDGNKLCFMDMKTG